MKQIPKIINEGTCKCIVSLTLEDDHGLPRTFINGREYQTNEFNDGSYQIFLTGGWNPSWIVSSDLFNECFEMIRL